MKPLSIKQTMQSSDFDVIQFKLRSQPALIDTWTQVVVNVGTSLKLRVRTEDYLPPSTDRVSFTLNFASSSLASSFLLHSVYKASSVHYF